MAPRALWKGFLKIDELVCPVALHAAASTAERMSFHIINRKTGDRVRREMVDEETGKPVPREDQVKGYRTEENRYILLDPEEVASAVPKSDKTLDVSGFLACDAIETEYFDKPYYLTPADSGARAAYGLIHAAWCGSRQQRLPMPSCSARSGPCSSDRMTVASLLIRSNSTMR